MTAPIRLAFGVLAMLAATSLGQAARAQSTPGTPAPAPAAPAGAPAPAATTAPGKVSGAAAWAALVGNTIAGKSAGDTFSEYFDPAGAVRYVDKNGVSTGTWVLQGNKTCFDFPEDDDKSCSTFEVTGSAGSYVDDDGATIRFEILPGNPKGL